VSEATYYFNSKSSDVWTDSAKMIDHVLTNYATTTSDGDTEVLDGNTCDGSDLGTISKVELSAYGYGDADDRIDLTPVFGGGDGDAHQTTPGVSAGWVTYVNITNDTNAPGIYEKNLTGASTGLVYGAVWQSQTFTPSGGHSVDFLDLSICKLGSPGNLTVGIRATADDKPTGDDLTSAIILEADIPESDEWVRCTFTAYSLSASTKYAIVLRAPSGDISNYVVWRDASSDVYANGQRVESTNSGDEWTGYDRDFVFAEGVLPTWTDIQNLDCKVAFTKVAKGNTMHCAEVAIRVTYTPSGGYYHGLKVQGEGELALCDVGSNPLRIRKGDTTYGIELVPTDDPNASAVRIQTSSGTKAIRRYT